MVTRTAVKENASLAPVLGGRWVGAAAALTAAALLAAGALDRQLPAPRAAASTPPDAFAADIAHEHLVNLTAMGPRVAGSYENEVLAVGVLVAAIKDIALGAGAHNYVELDIHRGSGGFPLAFFDGMNNIYRNVQSVVARVRGAGGGRRRALLLNCHFDSVPGSPGASDDAAACAVLLGVLRALAAAPRPLKHDVVFLFNGAEENIMQASHSFITTHKWARDLRAFINLEACGAGGREVLFQAGGRGGWLLGVYAQTVPRPYASSLAQELFQSGLIPADTDFRIFRDFGNLSGVDMAWSTNGYVYHTRLDTSARVPPAVLQRTGDNVLALVHGLLLSEQLELDPGYDVAPVFFDVLGLVLVLAGARTAALLAAAALALLLLRLHCNASDASKQLYVSRWAWWRGVGGMAGAMLGGLLAGVGAAAALGVLQAAGGAALAVYARAWLIAPLYTGVCVAAALQTATWLSRDVRVGAVPARGWAGARLAADAHCALWGALLLLLAAAGLRSGFLPLLWVLLPALADHVARRAYLPDGWRAVCWAGGALLPLLQTWYLALGSLQMFVPLAGRAGTAGAPDAALGALAAALALAALGWMFPLVRAAQLARKIAVVAAAISAVTLLAVLTTELGAAYSAECPQRLMLFHTRRTLPAPGGGEQHRDLYWVPHLDDNTPQSLAKLMGTPGGSGQPLPQSGAECALWPYCGAPYMLPVLGLVARGYWLPARAPPPLQLGLRVSDYAVNETVQALQLDISGPSHVVLIVSPVEGATVSWVSELSGAPLPGAAWGRRRTYFLTLHDARPPAHWNLTLHIQHSLPSRPPHWAALSVAAHDMGAAPEPGGPMARLPPWTAPSGWPVHLRLLQH